MKTCNKDNQLYFYLGMLPTSANKETLQSSLAHLGKIDRARVARDKADMACKGYGYAVVEPLHSASEFVQGCLALPNPIIAFQIPGPKLLGSENTKMLRRYARVESLAGKASLLDAVFFAKMFGSVAVIAAEVDKQKPDVVYRLHVLYKADGSLKNLRAMRRPVINGQPIEVHEYQGHQEYPFEPHANSKTVVVISDLTPEASPSVATKGRTAAASATGHDSDCVSEANKSTSVHSRDGAALNGSFETPNTNDAKADFQINGRKFKSDDLEKPSTPMKEEEESDPFGPASQKEPLGAAAKSRLKKFRQIFEKRHTHDNLRFNFSIRDL
jgi:hypothetical protein